MTNEHERWVSRLSEYVDGDLEEPARSAAEAHVAACPECRGIVAGLHRVVEVAGTLGDRPPARDLWPGIARAIGAGDSLGAEVIALPTAAGRARPSEGLVLSIPQLTAAAAIVMLLSVSATVWIGPGLPAGGPRSGGAPELAAVGALPGEPPEELAPELRALEEVLRQARDRLDPETLRILDKNLDVIEHAIEDSRKALAVDPGNAFLRDHIDRAWERKLTYLEQAARIAEWSG